MYFTGTDASGNRPSLWKLDTNTGTSSSYFVRSFGSADIYHRVLLSSNNQRLYLSSVNNTGYVLDTATDTLAAIPNVRVDYIELALPADQSTLGLGPALLDGDLNLRALVDVNSVDSYDESFVAGEKLSANGKLLFQPLQNGILIADAHTGRTLRRVALPFTLSSQFDALVSDGRDNELIAISGDTGPGSP